MGTETQIFDHESRLSIIEADLKTNNRDTSEILKILKGDNGAGLTTKVALVKQSVKRLWWFVGPMALLIVCAGLKHLIK